MSGQWAKPIARIIIYLGLPLPAASSDPPENRPGKPIVFIRSCFGWGLHGSARYRTDGSLLHCLSTLTCLAAGGLFLLHWPWSHLHRTLSGILPYEARTFLTHLRGRDYLSYLFFRFYIILYFLSFEKTDSYYLRVRLTALALPLGSSVHIVKSPVTLRAFRSASLPGFIKHFEDKGKDFFFVNPLL